LHSSKKRRAARGAGANEAFTKRPAAPPTRTACSLALEGFSATPEFSEIEQAQTLLAALA
jgi:hypothetical protein